jgi:hypothetical protein
MPELQSSKSSTFIYLDDLDESMVFRNFFTCGSFSRIINEQNEYYSCQTMRDS